MERVKSVGSNKDVCGCFIRTKHKLPCACQLFGLQVQDEHVPLESIHVFWKKLYNQEHGVTQEDNGTQLDLEEVCEELKRYFSTLDTVS